MILTAVNIRLHGTSNCVVLSTNVLENIVSKMCLQSRRRQYLHTHLPSWILKLLFIKTWELANQSTYSTIQHYNKYSTKQIQYEDPANSSFFSQMRKTFLGIIWYKSLLSIVVLSEWNFPETNLTFYEAASSCWKVLLNDSDFLEM